jgi:hypothetical protein
VYLPPAGSPSTSRNDALGVSIYGRQLKAPPQHQPGDGLVVHRLQRAQMLITPHYGTLDSLVGS